MKEVTYGWYPSVKDVYRPKGKPQPYHLECLYRYGDSLYYQGQVPPPQPELFVRGISPSPPQTPQDRRRKAKSVPVPKFSQVPKLHIPTPTQCWTTQKQAKGIPETVWGVATDPTLVVSSSSQDICWPLPANKKQQQQQKIIQQQLQKHQQQELLRQHIQQEQEKYFSERHQAPQYAWGMRTSSQDPPCLEADTPKAELKWPVAQRVIPVRAQSAAAGQVTDRQLQQQLRREQQLQQYNEHLQKKQQSKSNIKTRPASSPTRPASTAIRVGFHGQKSARCKTSFEPAPPATASKTTQTQRPVRIQSATVRRDRTPLPTRPVTAGVVRHPQPPAEKVKCWVQVELPTSRPPAPVPFIYDVNDSEAGDNEDYHAYVLRPTSPEEEEEYEDVVNKHGWRAEVHGDPYGLKKTSTRPGYFVTCSAPDLPPEAPRVHMETNEPFFYNSIPARPLSFAVDKEWMSELLVAKRLELQKREGGVNYDYKNFSFIY